MWTVLKIQKRGKSVEKTPESWCLGSETLSEVEVSARKTCAGF